MKNNGSTGNNDCYGILPTVDCLDFLKALMSQRSEEVVQHVHVRDGTGDGDNASDGNTGSLSIGHDVSDGDGDGETAAVTSVILPSLTERRSILPVCISTSSSSFSPPPSSSSSSSSSTSSSSSNSYLQTSISEKLDLFCEKILVFPKTLSGLCDNSADRGPKTFQSAGANVSVHAFFISTAADIVEKNILGNLLPFNECNGKFNGMFSQIKFDLLGNAVIVAWLYIVRALGTPVTHDILQNMSAEELIFLAECSLDYLLKFQTHNGSKKMTSNNCVEVKNKSCRRFITEKEFLQKKQVTVLSTLQLIMAIWSTKKEDIDSLNNINYDENSDNNINNDSDNDNNYDNDNNDLSHGLRNLRRAWILIGYVEYLSMVDMNKKKEKLYSREKGDIRVRDEEIKKINEKKKENKLGMSKERRLSSRIIADKMDIDDEMDEKEKVQKAKEREKDSAGKTSILHPA